MTPPKKVFLVIGSSRYVNWVLVMNMEQEERVPVTDKEDRSGVPWLKAVKGLKICRLTT